MDKPSSPVVTAIADAGQESFVAATLVKLGYQVIYRATSSEHLATFIAHNSNVILIASDDFRRAPIGEVPQTLIIRGKSSKITLKSPLNPTNEVELGELLRNIGSNGVDAPVRPPRPSAQVIAALSISQSPGVTSTAINLAHELAGQGMRVLLLDCNFKRYELAAHFEANGIFKTESETKFGFAIGEINSWESLNTFAAIANSFQYIICDLGLMTLRQLSSPARRIEDAMTIWVLQSAIEVLFISLDHDLPKIESYKETISKINPATEQIAIVRLLGALSSRDREKLQREITTVTGMDSILLTRDSKALDRMKSERSTVIASSPKSPLRSEISTLAAKINHG
jgi:hypothetical protein